LYQTNLTSLIAGGERLKKGSWPWIAAFYHNFKYICGGSIVSERVILTASHCIQDKGDEHPKLPEHSNFVVGKHDLSSNSENDHINVGVLKFIMHPKWKPQRTIYDADIAVVILKEPLVFRRNIRPICLPQFSDNHEELVSQSGVLAGWGFNEENKLTTNDPRIIEIPVIDDDECLRNEPNYEKVMSDRGFCTAGNLGKGPCKGECYILNLKIVPLF
jgi:secreted trypsin-like serine protease